MDGITLGVPAAIVIVLDVSAKELSIFPNYGASGQPKPRAAQDTHCLCDVHLTRTPWTITIRLQPSYRSDWIRVSPQAPLRRLSLDRGYRCPILYQSCILQVVLTLLLWSRPYGFSPPIPKHRRSAYTSHFTVPSRKNTIASCTPTWAERGPKLIVRDGFVRMR